MKNNLKNIYDNEKIFTFYFDVVYDVLPTICQCLRC